MARLIINQKKEIDFTDYVNDRTQDFTGREWLFRLIQNWLADANGSRYFLLKGEPGSGKTAIAGQLVKNALAQKAAAQAPFPHATHFCSASRLSWIVPTNFAESIALQLAQVEEYAKALLEIDTKQVIINSTQSVGTAINSSITAVAIHNLELRSVMSAQEAFTLLVLDPLQEIYKNGFQQQIVILVDSLDESLAFAGEKTIIDLLSAVQELPKQVRFLLTSRPKIEALEHLEKYASVHSLSMGEGLQESRKDVNKYILNNLEQQPDLVARFAVGLSKDAFVSAVGAKSDGNFLYITYLLKMLPQEQTEISKAVIDKLPNGLDGIYQEFLYRLVGKDRKTWRNQYASVLGTLAVVQEAISKEQLAKFVDMGKSEVKDVLEDILQFLDVDDTLPMSQRTYIIYHRSLADFLFDEDRAEYYFCDKTEQLQRIIDFYKKMSKSWEQLQEIDRYGLRHLANHLIQAGNKEQLYNLLTDSSSWMNAKFAAFSNDKAYVDDLEFALGNFANPLAPHEIVRLTQIYAVRQVIYHRASRNTDTDLKTLIWLGGEAEAIYLAHQRSDAVQRFRGLLTIHKTLQEKGQPPNAALVREMWESAQAIEIWTHRTEALRELATVLGQIGHRAEVNEIFTEAIESIKNKTEQAMEEAVTLTSESIGFKEWSGQFDGLKELAFVLIQLGQFVEAKRVIQKLESSCPGDDSWRKRDLINLHSQLSIALAQAAQFDEAEMVARTINDSEAQADTFKHLAINLAQAKRFAQAERIIQNITSPAMQTQALKHLAVAFAHAGQLAIAIATFSEAKKMVQAIEDDADRSETLSELAIALLQVGQSSDAMQIFTDAKEIALSIKNYNRQAAALGKLAIALASVKYFAEAEQVARTIEDYWKQAEILRQIGTMLMQAGQESKALVTFTNVREINRVAETNDDRPETLRRMALAFAQTGQLIDAEQTAQAIESLESRALVLKEIAVMLMQIGHQDEAVKFIQNAKEAAYAGKSDTALRSLVSALVQFKEFTEAEQAAQAIHFGASRMASLREIATALARLGQFTEAERLIQSMETGGHQVIALRELASAKQSNEVKQEVQLIDPSKNPVLVLSQIGNALLSSDCQTEASKLLDEAEQLIQLLNDSSKEQVKTLKKLKGILIHLFQSGNVVEAERVARSIENEKQRSEALSHLSTEMALTMNFKGAFNTLGLSDMNTYLSVLSEWTPVFEKVELGLSAKVLKEVIRIFGWVHPDWQKLSQLLDSKTL